MSFTLTVKVGKVVASVPTGWLGGKLDKRVVVLEESYLQSRIEAIRHGTARTGKSGLGGGMILHMELESDGISGLSSNGVRLERKNTGATYDNTMVRSRGR